MYHGRLARRLTRGAACRAPRTGETPVIRAECRTLPGNSMIEKHMSRAAKAIGFSAAVALLAVPGFAQVEVAPNANNALNPDSFYGKESTEGVYVRDSATAVEKLALAQKMEKLKEWAKSADLYQEVIGKY